MLISPHTLAPLMSDDPRLVGALGYLEPIIDRGSGSTPLDDMYHAIEESVHLLCDLRLDLLAASQDTTALAASDRLTFFRRNRHNFKN